MTIFLILAFAIAGLIVLGITTTAGITTAVGLIFMAFFFMFLQVTKNQHKIAEMIRKSR